MTPACLFLLLLVVGIDSKLTRDMSIQTTSPSASLILQTKVPSLAFAMRKPTDISRPRTSSRQTILLMTTPIDIPRIKVPPTDISYPMTKPTGISRLKTTLTDVSRLKTKPTDISRLKTKPTDISRLKTKPTDISRLKTKPTDISRLETKPFDISRLKTKPTDIYRPKTTHTNIFSPKTTINNFYRLKTTPTNRPFSKANYPSWLTTPSSSRTQSSLRSDTACGDLCGDPCVCLCSGKRADCSLTWLSYVPLLPANITELDLANGLFSIEKENFFINVRGITRLDLSENKLVFIHPRALAPLVALTELDASHNPLLPAAALRALLAPSSLESLNLAYCGLHRFLSFL